MTVSKPLPLYVPCTSNLSQSAIVAVVDQAWKPYRNKMSNGENGTVIGIGRKGSRAISGDEVTNTVTSLGQIKVSDEEASQSNQK